MFCTDGETTRTSAPVSVLLTSVGQWLEWESLMALLYRRWDDTYLCASSDVVGSVHHDPQRLEREHTQVAGTHRGLETNTKYIL